MKCHATHTHKFSASLKGAAMWMVIISGCVVAAQFASRVIRSTCAWRFRSVPEFFGVDCSQIGPKMLMFQLCCTIMYLAASYPSWLSCGFNCSMRTIGFRSITVGADNWLSFHHCRACWYGNMEISLIETMEHKALHWYSTCSVPVAATFRGMDVTSHYNMCCRKVDLI